MTGLRRVDRRLAVELGQMDVLGPADDATEHVSEAVHALRPGRRG